MGMPGPRKVNRYGIEFKLRAVKMSEAAWCGRKKLQPVTVQHGVPAAAP